MRNQWRGCFVFVFYFIADGPSLTVYTERALLGTKTFSCRTLARTGTASPSSQNTTQRISHQWSPLGLVHGDEIWSDCAASVSGWSTNLNSAQNQHFIYGHIDHSHRLLLVCCATFRLWLQRISARILKEYRVTFSHTMLKYHPTQL